MRKPRIKLLALDLIDKHPEKVAMFYEAAQELDLLFGWHYVLDVIWALAGLDALGLPRGATVLDAGAGNGVMQFCLSRRGYRVLSVDFADRRPARRMRERYRIEEAAGLNKRYDHPYLRRDGRVASPERPGLAARPWRALDKIARGLRDLFSPYAEARAGRGPILFYRADLQDLGGIEPDSIDAVVSISVVEHNDEAQVPRMLSELDRVLKPGAPMFITTSASGGPDWFHEESHGWCYSEETLRRLFFKGRSCESDYGRYAELMEEMRSSEHLRSRLHPFYFKSGKNGMPWGIWDPKYYPVGLELWKGL